LNLVDFLRPGHRSEAAFIAGAASLAGTENIKDS